MTYLRRWGARRFSSADHTAIGVGAVLRAYLGQLDYCVANDTGPMHLAVAMRVPTVGIFGHADDESYGSYPSPTPFRAVTLDCGKKPGPTPRAVDPRHLLEITVDDVMSSFLSLKNTVETEAASPSAT